MIESPTSNKTVVSPNDQPRALPMYRAVVGVGVVCALVIVLVYEVTRPIIRQNMIELRRRAIMDVLPGAVRSATFRLSADGSFESAPAGSEGNDLVFAGYDEQGALVGLAIEASAMGYQDVIRLLYGYSFEQQAIIGTRVLESRETPGLGDRIETDSEFLKNFEQLDVHVTADGASLMNPIEFVKPGEKTAAWQIDGISGATISSQATAEMLRESTEWWIPRVRERKTDFLDMDGGN